MKNNKSNLSKEDVALLQLWSLGFVVLILVSSVILLTSCSHARFAGHKESDSKFGWFNMGKEEYHDDQSRLKDSTLYYCTAEASEPICKQPTIMNQE